LICRTFRDLWFGVALQRCRDFLFWQQRDVGCLLLFSDILGLWLRGWRRGSLYAPWRDFIDPRHGANGASLSFLRRWAFRLWPWSISKLYQGLCPTERRLDRYPLRGRWQERWGRRWHAGRAGLFFQGGAAGKRHLDAAGLGSLYPVLFAHGLVALDDLGAKPQGLSGHRARVWTPHPLLPLTHALQALYQGTRVSLGQRNAASSASR
jgi:hypothetical protein